MKKKLLASLTGIALSAAIVVSGCAGTANTASAASDEKSVVQEAGAENAAGEAADQAADQTAGQAVDQSAGESADQSTAELKTVEPSAYAGQTVYGKVTAVNGSDVTVTLGTMKKKSKKSTTESDSAKDTAAADTTAEDKTSEKGKKKKSPFTSNGEQMTVTISDGLTEAEIKEGKILKLTLDDSGTVTSVEVKSKSKSRSGSGSKTGTSSDSGSKTETASDSGGEA